MAQLFEPVYVEGNVVVYEEDCPGSAVAGIANVTQHAFKRVRVKVAAPHFDDRAETAVIRATARSLDHIHLAAQQGVALEHPSTTIRRADLIIFQAMHRPSRTMDPTVAFATRQATDTFAASSPLQCP